MIGKKIYKPLQNDFIVDQNGIFVENSAENTLKKYSEVAKWCNANNATIEDKGDCYEVVAIPPHVPSTEEIQKMLTDGVQAYMDIKAQERGYDNIHTACSYANSTDEIFKAEGTACLAWRDSVWRKCYNILDEVKAGKRAIPTLEEVIAELPVLVW